MIMNPTASNPAKNADVEAVVTAPPKRAQTPDDVALWRKLVAEFVGAMLLTAAMVGSGIQGFALSNGSAALALLAMSITTWGILFALISVFDTVSRGHFNPIVTLAEALRFERPAKNVTCYIVVQVVGAIFGTIVAHGMFAEADIASFDGLDRTSGGEYLGELITTFVLLVVNFGANKKDVGMALGLAVLAGYWYTSSQCFANPAVTIGRAFTSSFAGIAPASVPVYLAGQLSGMMLAVLFSHFVLDGRTVAELTRAR